MKRSMKAITLLAAVAAVGSVATSGEAQPQGNAQSPWSGCCGVSLWNQGQGGTMGQWGVGQDAVGSSVVRNHIAMGWGVPAPYDRLRNPLPRTRTTIERGASVYARSCAGCHGDTGLGDGPTGRTLSPPPANLAWLSRMPVSRWDSFMYWTVSEGGAPLGTAMPSFKGSLSKDDRWAVIAYIQARLPVSKSR